MIDIFLGREQLTITLVVLLAFKAFCLFWGIVFMIACYDTDIRSIGSDSEKSEVKLFLMLSLVALIIAGVL